MAPSDWTLLLSGPLAQRAPLLDALGPRCIDTAQQRGDPSHGLPRADGDGWLTVRSSTVDLGDVAARAGWVLRLHWPTPTCPVCGGRAAGCGHCAGLGRTNRPASDPDKALRAELDSLRARLEALEGRAS